MLRRCPETGTRQHMARFRGARGTLKARRRPSAARGAGNAAGCQAGEYASAWKSMTAGSSCRLPGAAPPGSAARRSAADLQPRRQRLPQALRPRHAAPVARPHDSGGARAPAGRTSGLRAVAGIAGRLGARHGMTARPIAPLQLAACVQATARLPPDLQRAAAATGLFVPANERLHDPCGPAGGRSDSRGAGRAAGRQKRHSANASNLHDDRKSDAVLVCWQLAPKRRRKRQAGNSLALGRGTAKRQTPLLTGSSPSATRPYSAPLISKLTCTCPAAACMSRNRLWKGFER